MTDPDPAQIAGGNGTRRLLHNAGRIPCAGRGARKFRNRRGASAREDSWRHSGLLRRADSKPGARAPRRKWRKQPLDARLEQLIVDLLWANVGIRRAMPHLDIT
jgi:hypothetical protein